MPSRAGPRTSQLTRTGGGDGCKPMCQWPPSKRWRERARERARERERERERETVHPRSSVHCPADPSIAGRERSRLMSKACSHCHASGFLASIAGRERSRAADGAQPLHQRERSLSLSLFLSLSHSLPLTLPPPSSLSLRGYSTCCNGLNSAGWRPRPSGCLGFRGVASSRGHGPLRLSACSGPRPPEYYRPEGSGPCPEYRPEGSAASVSRPLSRPVSRPASGTRLACG